jgi:hypothetical protein
MNPTELSIGTEIFADLRIKMDAALNAVISNMISKNMGSGKVTAKIDITLNRKTDEETGEIHYEPVFEPVVNVSIGAKGKMECSAPVGLILKQTKNGRNVIGTNQISMDDLITAEQKGA